MLREIRKAVGGPQGKRVGYVVANNGDGTYDISVDGTRYNNVPSVAFRPYAVGESVTMTYSGGRPAIEP